MVKRQGRNSVQRRDSPFHLGDRVKLTFGCGKVTGVIVEEFGPIGVQGRHLFRVEIPMDPFDPMTLEMAEDEIEAAGPDEEATKPLEKEKVVEYLKYGGILLILRSNMAGGKYQPRAWLCRDTLGNVTHTLVPERGIVGGQIVPSSAIWEGKVAKAKKDAVVAFVESFGLTHAEAEAVVSEVGTSPR